MNATESVTRRKEAVAIFQRACRQQIDGHHADALASYEQALELDDTLAEAHNNLASLLLLTHRPLEAIPHLERAIELKPRLKESWNCLGAAQQAVGLLDEALASFRRAVEIGPDYAAAHCNLGKALREAGDLAEAKVAYEKAVALEPRSGHYHRLLANAEIGRGEDAHFAQMVALSKELESLTLDDRIELHFALGKAYGDREDFEKSFQHLRDGNALARSCHVYDESKTLEIFDAVPKMFNGGLIEVMRGCGYLDFAPIFVFGMPRAGTTLVEQVLAAHPSVYAGGELGVFAESGEELGAFENALRAFRRIDADLNDAPRTLALLGDELRALGSRYAKQVQSIAPQAARITDKWPWNFKFAGVLHLALPNARLIHVRRDALDTCFSCFATMFSGPMAYTYDLRDMGRYYRAYERLMDHWRDALPAGAMLEVAYEDFVADFDRQARRVLEFCDLEWDPACAEFWKVKRPVRTTSAVAVRQPLYRSAAGRARAYLPYLGELLSALER